MIISHRKKFAFFCNQRTGSKAVGIVLRMSGIFDENDILIAQPFPATRTASIEIPAYNLGDYRSSEVNHVTPQKAIDAGFITLAQLREYDCYAFLRDPEERFYAVRSSMQIDRNGNPAMPGRRVSGIAPQQYEFFYVGQEQVVTPLNFDNYEAEVNMLVTTLGGYTHMDIPTIARKHTAYMPNLKVVFNHRDHGKDIRLYKEMINAVSNSQT